MATDFRRGFMTDEPAQEPRGGLASEAIGGLSKFLGDVNRGIEVVMSHPLYQRAWSGFVSGQTGDPTAGPRALAQMQQNAIDQRTQAALMDRQKIDWQREDEAYTTGRENALLRQRNIERLQQALAGGDQYGVRAGLAALDPVKAAEGFLAPPKAPTQRKLPLPGGRVQQQEFVDGRWVDVGEPGEPAGLVNINNTDPNLTRLQQYNLEESMRADYEKKSEPFVKINSSIDNFDELLAESERDPSALASQRATYAFQRALDDAAVMESDVKRILGTNYTNVLRGWVNAPQLATRDQLVEMRELLQQARRVAARRQKQIDDQMRSLVETRQLNPIGVMPGGGYSSEFDFDEVPTVDATTQRGAASPKPVRARRLP